MEPNTLPAGAFYVQEIDTLIAEIQRLGTPMLLCAGPGSLYSVVMEQIPKTPKLKRLTRIPSSVPPDWGLVIMSHAVFDAHIKFLEHYTNGACSPREVWRFRDRVMKRNVALVIPAETVAQLGPYIGAEAAEAAEWEELARVI